MSDDQNCRSMSIRFAAGRQAADRAGAPSCSRCEESAMKTDAEVLLMLRERAKGRSQQPAPRQS